MSVSDRSASSGPPPATITHETRASISIPRQAKRGRDGYWQLVAEREEDKRDKEDELLSTPAPGGSGISLVFKVPPSAGGESRTTSPTSTVGSRDKRRAE